MRGPGCALGYQVRAFHGKVLFSTVTARLAFYSPPPQLCCLLRLQNPPQNHLWEGFLLYGNFSSFTTPSPGQISVPNSFASLFVFYILSYLHSKRMGCLSGYLVFSASIQKLFCGSCSAFKWSFDEFLGEKVVFPSYSSSIFYLFGKNLFTKHLFFLPSPCDFSSSTLKSLTPTPSP